MAYVRVKYVADNGPWSEASITGKQQSWRKNDVSFVSSTDADLLIASGKFVLASSIDAVDDEDTEIHAAEHAAMGIFDDGTPGACVTRSERNISHTVTTKVFLPSAPIELAILWVESGTSGNLKFVLEAASDLDADSRLANDAAHGEISSGDNILVRFTPTSNPMNIYLLATSAVGAGSNIATIIAKVTE